MRAPRRPLRDAKTELQEWAQALGKPAPTYRLVDRSGPDHAPHFVIEVAIGEVETAQGEGASKRDAEQAAARALMLRERLSEDAENV
jgi:ribonuclease-3